MSREDLTTVIMVPYSIAVAAITVPAIFGVLIPWLVSAPNDLLVALGVFAIPFATLYTVYIGRMIYTSTIDLYKFIKETYQ